jgi:hypothetical protein
MLCAGHGWGMGVTLSPTRIYTVQGHTVLDTKSLVLHKHKLGRNGTGHRSGVRSKCGRWCMGCMHHTKQGNCQPGDNVIICFRTTAEVEGLKQLM